MEFDLAGFVRLVVDPDAPRLFEAVRSHMDPYRPHADGSATDGAGVSVRLAALPHGAAPLAELQLRAGDGLVTGWDGKRLFAIAGRRRASIPNSFDDEQAEYLVEEGFPLGRLFRQAIRTGLQLRALAGSAVALHGAAVDTDDGAVLVCGWSESGKTETALALAEDGRRFLSDKWTLIDPARQRAAAFPISVGVRRGVVRYLPRLRAALPASARARLAIGAAAEFVTAPVRSARGAGARGFVADGAERAVALVERAALSASAVARAYGHDPITTQRPIRLVVALRTIPGGEITAAETDTGALSRRLALTAAAERQIYWAYRTRAAYAAGTPDDQQARVIERESSLIADLLARVPHVEVAAPFPVDPRRVAAAVEPWLATR
jgi:hypothetical protein